MQVFSLSITSFRFCFPHSLNLLHLKIRNLNNCFSIQQSHTEDIYWSARNVFIFLRVWSFRRIQKRIFDPRFAGLRGRKEREIRNWICSLGNLSQKRAICMTALKKWRVFYCLTNYAIILCKSLWSAFRIANSDDGTYKTNQERRALRLKII